MEMYDPPTAAVVVVGTTVLSGGTNTRVLFDDGGVIGESAALTYIKATGALSATLLTGATSVNAGATTGYLLGGTSAMIGDATYTKIFNGAGTSAAITLGNAGDRSNYYDTTTHNFRSANAVSTFLSITAAGTTQPIDRGLLFTNQTSGAGAQAGTITNAPTVGNPGHWLKVVIGGTNYAIPAWLG